MDDYNHTLELVKDRPECGKMRPFIKGGIWRNFLAKYPESDHMHNRMLMVSGKVHEALGGADKPTRDQARMVDHLYQCQCNDAYWHGVFGGLYLPHLRSAVYEHLIAAEAMADAVLKGGDAGHGARGRGKQAGASGPSWLTIERGDFDRDGCEEIMVNSEMLNVFLDPADGGRITELDWKPRSFNLMNTLTRRREGYHAKIAHAGKDTGEAKTIHDRVVVKEEGLQHHLQYDWYPRASLLDHFLESGVDVASFMKAEYYEAGDFVLGSYTAAARQQKDSAVVVLEREGNAEGLAVQVRKTLTMVPGGAGFTAAYAVTNRDREELNTTFGSEFNFSLLAGNAHDRYYDIPGHILDKRNLASFGETNNVGRVRLVDEWLKVTVALEFSQPAVLWRAPVETVSQSEAGFERVYQSSMVMPLWRISLPPGKTWEIEIRLTID